MEQSNLTSDEQMMPTVQIAAELISLAVKAGRRASYDLKHACSYINDPEMEKYFTRELSFG